jgi:hypothetical protein
MSALPPKPDIEAAHWNVRYGPSGPPNPKVRADKLMFVGNSLEGFGSALNPIRQAFVASIADDLA